MPRPIDGKNVIYHYLQKVIIPRDDDFSRQLIFQLVVDLSIWLPAGLYREVPVLLPYCVRDGEIRGREWGSANARGYLRDNNSLLKLLVGNYAIRSPRLSFYQNMRRGRGFVACHLWRRIYLDGEKLVSPAHPKTYSFLPNLAWLPAQVARLTDHEGSFAQQLLQVISHQLYAAQAADHPPELAMIWQALPRPELELQVDLEGLNYFIVSQRAIHIRRNHLLDEIATLEEALERGSSRQKSPHSARYLPSLLKIPAEQTAGLRQWLRSYRQYLQNRARG